MRPAIRRRLSILEQRGGAAGFVVRIRAGETAADAIARHTIEYPHTRGRTVAVIPTPLTASEWSERHCGGAP